MSNDDGCTAWTVISLLFKNLPRHGVLGRKRKEILQLPNLPRKESNPPS